MADCPECGARLPLQRFAGCLECTWRPSGRHEAEEVSLRACLACGGVVSELGWCDRGHAYALAYSVLVRDKDGTRRLEGLTPCPFVCSVCRGKLAWVGGCDACHGSLTPSDPTTWRMEGDRYEVDPLTRHYAITQRAPLRLATSDEAEAAFAALRSLVRRIGRPIPESRFEFAYA